MGKFTGHTITSDSALGAAKIQRSLRFYEPNPSDENSTAATNLTRTPSSTGNRKIWTFSSWMKKFHCIGSGNASAAYQITDRDRMRVSTQMPLTQRMQQLNKLKSVGSM